MEKKIITSGFYTDAERAAEKINNIITELGVEWQIIDFKVNTVENICNKFYTTDPSTVERRMIIYSQPMVCYSAIAIKEDIKSQNLISDNFTEENNYLL